ncbi:MAG: twin-arginine translocation signal domain-containing protein [Proteobacteria bacterium]|nr:twin-arginine translocation signal domain-containing protein [Pseudomonadota bacterium]
MTKKDEAATNSRRDFLKMASVAAPAVAVAVTGKAAVADTPDQNAGEGLQDTAHTRAYFDSARF